MTQKPQTPRSLVTNGVYSAASELSIGLLFILTIFAARILGDAGFGVFSFALAFVNVMGFVMEGGLSFVYARIVARDPASAPRFLGNVLTLQLIFCAAGIALVVVVAAFLDQPAETMQVIYLLALAEALRFFKYLFRYAFRAADVFHLEALTVYVERVLLLAVALVLLLGGYGVVGLAWAFVITRIIDLLIVLAVYSRALFLPTLRFEIGLWPNIVRQSVPFILTAAVVMMLYKVDSVILALVHSDAEVGWYNAAYRLIEGLYLFPKILSSVLFPRLSEAYRDQLRVTRLYTRGLRYVLVLALPLTLVGIPTAEAIIDLIYGAEYQNAVIALQILLLSLIFLFIYEISFALLGAISRQRIFFYFSAIALALNIGLNIILIPPLSYVGAGIATVLAQLVFAVLIGVYIHLIGYRLPYLRLALRPLLAASAVGLLAHFFSGSLFVILPVTALAYFALLTVTGYWDAQELALARAALAQARRHLPGHKPV